MFQKCFSYLFVLPFISLKFQKFSIFCLKCSINRYFTNLDLACLYLWYNIFCNWNHIVKMMWSTIKFILLDNQAVFISVVEARTSVSMKFVNKHLQAANLMKYLQCSEIIFRYLCMSVGVNNDKVYTYFSILL